MLVSRREWMLASLCWSELVAASSKKRSSAFLVLTADEAAEVQALANIILPETDTPGAHQAQAVGFIDAALAGYDSDQLDVYRNGLADVALRCQQLSPPNTRYASLDPVHQIGLLKSIETTEFFEKLRIVSQRSNERSPPSAEHLPPFT